MLEYGTPVPPLRHSVSSEDWPCGAKGVSVCPFAVTVAGPLTTRTGPLVAGLNVGQPLASIVSKLLTVASFIVMW